MAEVVAAGAEVCDLPPGRIEKGELRVVNCGLRKAQRPADKGGERL